MPKASKVTTEESEEILQVSAKLKAENPQISAKKIGEMVGRSEKTVLRVMSDKRFSVFSRKYKKKVDQRRMEILQDADKQISEAVKAQKLNAYQLIGLSKTYYEQVFGLSNAISVNTSGEKIAVQVVRGVIGYNSKDDPNKKE